MRYFQCKCGHRTGWSSMGMPRCQPCPKCGTTLAEGPNSHLDPIPHEFGPASVSTPWGEVTGEVCRYCGRSREEIDAARPTEDEERQ